jgi:hypothetical protein
VAARGARAAAVDAGDRISRRWFARDGGHVVAAIRKGLSETGYVEGRDVVIEYRWAEGNYDQLPVLVRDLVRRQVAVIIPMGTPAAFAAKAATSTIPIVFGAGIDPVQAGLVASLHRPGGNVTGVTSINAEIETKRLGLLHELLPRATRFAVLVNPNSPLAESDIKDARASAKAIGGQIEILTASTREIDAAFSSLVQKLAEALLIGPDVFFTNRRVQLATLAVRHGVPAIYSFREFAEAGGSAHAPPKIATNKRSPCDSARPQPPPASKKRPKRSRRPGSIRGFISDRFKYGPDPPGVGARRAGTCHLHQVGRQAQMTN